MPEAIARLMLAFRNKSIRLLVCVTYTVLFTIYIYMYIFLYIYESIRAIVVCFWAWSLSNWNDDDPADTCGSKWINIRNERFSLISSCASVQLCIYGIYISYCSYLDVLYFKYKPTIISNFSIQEIFTSKVAFPRTKESTSALQKIPLARNTQRPSRFMWKYAEFHHNFRVHLNQSTKLCLDQI